MKNIGFVRQMFHEYYINFLPVNSISMVDKREFGFVSFDDQMIRHKSFKRIDELVFFLRNLIPKDVFFSCAYYENPTLEMDRKNWFGADLIFDIDANHIPTQCERIHDKWTCYSCGFSGRGATPEKCPLCGGEKLDEETWPCEFCLESAKFEAIKLLDILETDFGFSRNDIHVFFSGHRGYHVHVDHEAVRSLDSAARKEIVDYVSGIGLNISAHFVERKKLKQQGSPQFNVAFNFGWSKRLIEGLQAFLSTLREDDLRRLGFRKNTVTAIMQNKDVLLKSLSSSGIWHTIRGVGFKTFVKILENVLAAQSVRIDTVVTTDVHRLIRMPETLNSKTGFKKTEVPVAKIDEFDPFKNAVAFRSGKVKVKVLDAPKFRIGDEVFGPYRDKLVELPTAAALLLVCRGRAEVMSSV